MESHLENGDGKKSGKGAGKLDQGKIAEAMNEDRKRKARGDDGTDRFGKKSKGEGHETQNFDVSEEQLGMSFSIIF